MSCRPLWVTVLMAAAIAASSPAHAADLQPLRYNNPGLVVDLGVGLWAWPLPMDFDGDGDNDLVVVCPDKPSNGTYVFENVSGSVKFPVFKPGRRISRGLQNVQVSYVGGKPEVMGPARVYPDFLKSGLDKPVKLNLPVTVGHKGKVRANQWKQVDFDGDGRLDLIVGIGDWSGYGWDDAFDKTGKWTNGPLHGYVYLLRNRGSNDKPQYEKPRRLRAGSRVIDVYGRPSPNFADFDGDGDLDLICGEFLDGFTYFENVGTRTRPKYAAGRRLVSGGKPLRMDLQMITPVAFDWDRDGDGDLIVGDEDGRVALVENSGKVENGLPVFLPPRYFQQQARDLKFGALATPTAVDWDGDGDQDILCGNTAGYIGFFENLGGDPPKWAAPRLLRAGTEARPLQGSGKTIRIQAGPNGSIQGPCEAKWGYTTLTAGDWDGDGLPDLMVNSIWGKVIWYRNVGTKTKPKLAAAQAVEVEWPGKPPKPAWNWWDPRGKELVTQWRTTPVMVDFNRDGLPDLVMVDHEGYLAFFERSLRNGKRVLLPGRRVFVDEKGNPIRLNPGRAGKSGRRKIVVVDWDGDGKLDVLSNSRNADWWQNIGTRDGKTVLKNRGPLFPRNVAGHTSSPTVVDFNRDGVPDLLVGAEDGRLYYAEQKRKPTIRDSRP
jgi:FG-GAP-like repeat